MAAQNVFDLAGLKNALPNGEENGRILPGENFDRFYGIPVKVTGEGIPPELERITRFSYAGFGQILLGNIRSAGFVDPLPIQQLAIPYIQVDRDVLGHSVTGSGKTAAYVLPILDFLSKQMDADLPIVRALVDLPMPRAVVLLPTRELAIQVKDEFVKFAQGLNLAVKLIYGGGLGTIPWQKASIRSGCDILVATPGRLMSFLRHDEVSMAKCRYLVLDEADRMLDMNFEPQIRYIVERGSMPAKNIRQTLLFSATYPPAVQKICSDFLEESRVFIQIGEIGAANRDIVQEIIKTEEHEKLIKLMEILKNELKDIPEPGQPWGKKVLVFVYSKNEADLIYAMLAIREISVTVIHSKKEQPDREEALNKFKEGIFAVLVATSVAGRGLDIKGVDLVINYSLPLSEKHINEYVQRIGRTGRLGNRGRAISFFHPVLNKKFGNELLKVLTEAQQNIPDWFAEIMGVQGGPRYLD